MLDGPGNVSNVGFFGGWVFLLGMLYSTAGSMVLVLCCTDILVRAAPSYSLRQHFGPHRRRNSMMDQLSYQQESL
jgi:hypothetical protein